MDGLEQLSDEELIRRSREQPAQAARCIDVLFERAYPRVAQWCLRCSPNRDEAADLAQEVILRAYTRLESFRLESRFSTWLYTISRRVAIDRGIVRRRQDARTAPEEAADGVENGTPVAELVEQQYQRQPPACLLRPVVQLALGRTFDILGKFLFDFVVEDRVLAEPDVHAAVDLRCGQLLFLKPETKDGIDANLVVIGYGRFHAFA